MKYRLVDLCAGIGGIRRGFEKTGFFQTVASAEIDKYACKTYKHLYGDNPYDDIMSENFKNKLCDIEYDILSAGFPCQTFSRAGKQEGFNEETKGTIFFHIVDILYRTKPKAFFLENVDHLITHDKGKTFNSIIEVLTLDLNYTVIGTKITKDKNVIYDTKDFIRNSKNFGLPQNRPRIYIVGFHNSAFNDKLQRTNLRLPEFGNAVMKTNINDILENDVNIKYYMSSGYYETLIKHKERQRANGNGFGYCIINDPSTKNPIANTLLATGGSGKERNLIRDFKPGIAGKTVKGKQSPINKECIRVLTPTEWGRLQGFIDYGFINKNGEDTFSFPADISDAQKYKQFGNSVTIPVVEEIAIYIKNIFDIYLRHN